jgi:Helix-turn-helix domain
MIVPRAFKTELDLNNSQKTACARHAGAVRWVFNRGLARKIDAYEKGEKVPTAIDLHRQLNVLKISELAGMYEVSKCAPPRSAAQPGSGLCPLLPAGEREESRQEDPGRFPEAQVEAGTEYRSASWLDLCIFRRTVTLQKT